MSIPPRVDYKILQMIAVQLIRLFYVQTIRDAPILCLAVGNDEGDIKTVIM